MMQIVPSRVLRGTVLSALAYGTLLTDAGAATSSPGCEAANRGGLNMTAQAGGNASREARFEQGEQLTFSILTTGTAAVTVANDGDARSIHSGRATGVVFMAPSSGAYAFRLDADATAEARVDVRCSTLAKSNAERGLIERRKAFLTTNDPDRIRIDRQATEAKAIDSFVANTNDGAPPRQVTTSVSLSELIAAMKMTPTHQTEVLDFWFEGRYASYDTIDMDARQNDGNLSAMYLGTKYMLGPDIMLGYMAQFDQADEQSRYSGGVSASGWMAGPYVSVRFGPGIVFDGRASWGKAQMVPDGVMVDTTTANRALLKGTLRGKREVAGWTVAPSVGMSYVEDTPIRPGYGFTTAEPSGTGRLDALPEVKRRFDLNSKTYVEPRVAAGGFLSFDDMSRLAPGGLASATGDLHWKAEAGVAWGVKDSMNLEAVGGVETGGGVSQDNWSGKFKLNVPFGN